MGISYAYIYTYDIKIMEGFK